MKERTTSEKVYISLSLLGSISILPFAILRGYNGDVILAIVDGIISATLFSLFLYVYLTRKIDPIKIFIAMFIAIAALTSIVIKGQSQILWIPPSIIAIHYIMPMKSAGVINTMLLLIMLIIVFPSTDFIEYTTIIFTTCLTAILSFAVFRSYHQTQNELSQLATIDPLTHTGNRRSLDTKLSEVINSCKSREHNSTCLMILDLDGFKEINDEHGHAVGDEILIAVCKLVKDHTRVIDSLYRYGGDEFIITPLSMDIETAKAIAEKLRHLIANHKFVCDIKLTLSIGVSEYNHTDTPESWIHRADTALYQAKNAGRNQVC